MTCSSGGEIDGFKRGILAAGEKVTGGLRHCQTKMLVR